MSVKKRLQPEASQDSFFDVMASESTCCEHKGLTVCKYSVTVDFEDPFTAVTFKVDGVNVTKTISANSKKTLRQEIARVLKDAGYDPFFSMDNIIGVQTTATELIIIGEAEFVSLVNDTTKNFTKACEVTRIVKALYTLAVDSEDVPVSLNGATASEMAGPFNTTEGPALKSAIESALDAQGVVYTLVSVTEADGDFTIYIHMTSDAHLLSIGGVEGSVAQIYQDYL